MAVTPSGWSCKGAASEWPLFDMSSCPMDGVLGHTLPLIEVGRKQKPGMTEAGTSWLTVRTLSPASFTIPKISARQMLRLLHFRRDWMSSSAQDPTTVQQNRLRLRPHVTLPRIVSARLRLREVAL